MTRLEEEVAHGFQIAKDAERVWGWKGCVGLRRWQRRVELLKQGLTANSCLLEVGCGTGLLTEQLAKAGCTVVAIDICPALLDKAKDEGLGDKITFLCRNAMETGFSENSFDYVIGNSVLHHLEPKVALREFYRILRPNGRLRFTEPNMANPQIALQKNIPWLKKLAGDSPSETAFFRWSLGEWLYESGFIGVEIEPFDFMHPATPASCVDFVGRTERILEKVPLLREVAGSLWIEAEKPF